MSAADFITVVSGLPRSGTSLMMQMLRAGGIAPLQDDLRAADDSNPRGYFEFDPVKRLRADNTWLGNARGHAVKIIHLLLRELPLGAGMQYRVVFMQRPLDEVLASQRVMLERQGKKAVADEMLTRAFTSQLEQVERWLAEQPAFSVLRVDHHALFENPAPVCLEIDKFLGGGLDLEAMQQAVDPALYRQRMH